MSRSNQSGRLSLLVVTIVVLAMLLPSYFGAYYVMVESVFSIDTARVEVFPEYSVGGSFTEAFFTPAHWLDRMIRPDSWSF